jgi:hypothetical protein
MLKIETKDNCWIWTGNKNQDGYGMVRLDGKTRSTHRVSYELFVSEIPVKLVIDHLCRNRDCVNPEHMELVTNHENILRGVGIAASNSQKTHCHRGHEFTNDNTFISGIGSRNCKMCLKIRNDLRPRKIKGVQGLS